MWRESNYIGDSLWYWYVWSREVLVFDLHKSITFIVLKPQYGGSMRFGLFIKDATDINTWLLNTFDFSLKTLFARAISVEIEMLLVRWNSNSDFNTSWVQILIWQLNSVLIWYLVESGSIQLELKNLQLNLFKPAIRLCLVEIESDLFSWRHIESDVMGNKWEH